MIYSLNNRTPTIHPDTFVADSADIIGNVDIHSGASIWFTSVLRGDNDLIEVGQNSNIQDGSVIHVDPGHPVRVADHVTVGHRVTLHGCHIGSFSLVGINSVVLNDAEVGKYCLIGANSMITGGKVIPDRSLVMGSPAKVIRELTDEECQSLESAAAIYCKKVALYLESLQSIEGQ